MRQERIRDVFFMCSPFVVEISFNVVHPVELQCRILVITT
jgi:hypothetical protein